VLVEPEQLPQDWLSDTVCIAITRTPLVVMVRLQPRSFTIVVGAAFKATKLHGRRRHRPHQVIVERQITAEFELACLPVLARRGHKLMSDMSPLLGAKQT
jgi:hypothetical protein